MAEQNPQGTKANTSKMIRIPAPQQYLIPTLLLLLTITPVTQSFLTPHPHPSHTQLPGSLTKSDPIQFPPPPPHLPIPITNSEISQTAEADVAFRRALTFERNGQSRSAHTSFHEAATLYACLIEEITSEGSFAQQDFAHVTEFEVGERPGCLQVALAYACARLAYLSVDALGDAHAAARLYLDAIRIGENVGSCQDGGGDGGGDGDAKAEVHASYYDGMGTAIETAYGDLPRAIEAYRKGLGLLQTLRHDTKSSKTEALERVLSFHLSIALERIGGDDNLQESARITAYLRQPTAAAAATTASSATPSNQPSSPTQPTPTPPPQQQQQHHLDPSATHSYLVDSWGYVRWHTRRIPPPNLSLYGGKRTLLQTGVEAALPLIESDDRGLVCEFGVEMGRSLRIIQEILPLDTALHGFDYFGSRDVAGGDNDDGGEGGEGGGLGGRVPVVSGKVTFHDGKFVDTVPAFLEEMGKVYRPLAFANVDCESYASTLEVLEGMHSRVVPGTVFCFDEYLCHPTWRQEEFRAWRECCKRFGWQYEYLGFSLWTKQAVVRVTSA